MKGAQPRYAIVLPLWCDEGTSSEAVETLLARFTRGLDTTGEQISTL
jgi:hypothetical protein